MFTGIIEELGVLKSRRSVPSGITFTVTAPRFGGRLSAGDSLCVNGVCQTVETVAGDAVTFTAVGETLKRTTLGALRPRARVNLEAAATAHTALGGHIVQGHVDGVGTVASFEATGKDRLLSIDVPHDVFDLSVAKGSIAIDGVSLTIVELKAPRRVTITIIPFTLEHTIAGGYHRGSEVNVEADILGKYVMSYLSRIASGSTLIRPADM